MAEMLRRRLNEAEQPIFGMLLAGIPHLEIARTLGISPRALASREDAMLQRLEALPGEWPTPPRAQSRLDLDRPMPQAWRSSWRG
jgi:hypothetical protein